MPEPPDVSSLFEDLSHDLDDMAQVCVVCECVRIYVCVSRVSDVLHMLAVSDIGLANR